MTPPGTPDDGVNAFLVGERVLFSHYFDEGEVFAALKPYYNNHQYRFEVPIGAFPNVLSVLVRHGYEVAYHEDASDFAVAVKQYSRHPEDVFKQSVDHRSVNDWNCFLLRARAAVEQAVRTHARPIANAPVENPFDFAIRTDDVPRPDRRAVRRLSLAASADTLGNRFDVDVPEDYAPSYNVAPGAPLAVITNDRTATIERHHWGLVPFWADGPDDPKLLTTPVSTVADAPMVAEAVRHRRCLVLADGFYAWDAADDGVDAAGGAADVTGETADLGDDGADGKVDGATTVTDPEETTQPYRMTAGDERPFALAGIWECWAAGGDYHLSAAIITTDADEAIRGVTGRVPVILDADAQSRWLGADDADEATEALSADWAPDLRLSPVSRAVVDPANDDPAVAEAVDTSRQVGLDAFSGAEK